MRLPPPCKSLIYNTLCSAGCFLARIFFCLTAARDESAACDANAKGALVCDEENFSFPEECCLQPSNFSFLEERALALLVLSLSPRNFFQETLRDPSLGLRMNRCQTESRVSLLSLCRGAKEGNSKFISRYFCILGKQLYYFQKIYEHQHYLPFV